MQSYNFSVLNFQIRKRHNQEACIFHERYEHEGLCLRSLSTFVLCYVIGQQSDSMYFLTD